MGLDTSHDCWHGPYSAFNRWRNAVAVAGGYRVVRGLDPLFPHDEADLQWDRFQDKNFYGEWDLIPEDPLLLLLVHSDCEGIIKSEHAGWIADRLEAILPNMHDGASPAIENNRAITKRFLTGLRDAALRGEDVNFH